MNSSPWAKLTTSMMPKIRVRPEATSARIIPVTTPLMVWIRTWSSGMPITSPYRCHGEAPPGGAAISTTAPARHEMASLRSQRRRLHASHAEVLMNQRVIDLQFRGHRVMAHLALFDEVDPPAGRECQRHVLLDEQHGDPLAGERADDLRDL